MKALTGWIKERKKLIIVVLLIVVLVFAVFLFFGSDSQDTYGSGYVKSQTELKLVALLGKMDGVGDVEVMVTENDGVIAGVVIVCEGAESIMVRNDILNAVSTALDINKNIIAIYSM